MDSGRWQRLRELFDAAIDLGSEERNSYLDEACSGDPDLRRQVESLISSGKSQSPFITSAIEEELESNAILGHALETGKHVGVYKIVQRLGHGGMGSVYLGVRDDDAFQHRVAIKLVRTDVAGRETLLRFRLERQILANLEHPNIARLLDGGTTDAGAPYVVMEYVEGQPIDKYCDQSRLGIQKRLELFSSVCAAVHHAHQKLIVHRDIKPSNILVTSDGVPKLLDFGIAKLMNPEMTPQTFAVTRAAQRLLTPDYASPEQVRGQEITTSSDVYSLGVVLYDLLTGNRPLQIKSHDLAELERVICEQEPTRPSASWNRTRIGKDEYGEEAMRTAAHARGLLPEKLRRALSGDLDNIVLMALRKEPARRYASVQQFIEDIQRHLRGLPVIARADTARYRLSKFARRNKAVLVPVVLAVLALVAGFVTSTTLYLQAREARKAEEIQRRAAEFREYTAAIAAASMSLVEGDVLSARSRLDGAPKALRNWEWWQLWWQLDTSRLSSGLHRTGASALGLSADGRLVASGDYDGAIHVWETDTQNPVADLSGHTGRILQLGFLANGHLLSSGDDGTVRSWDVAAETDVLVWRQDLGESFVMSLDGTHVVWRSGQDGLILWDAISGAREFRIPPGSKPLAMHSNGQIVALSIGPTVILWSLTRDTEILRLSSAKQVSRAVFTHDGRRLWGASHDGSIVLWDLEDGSIIRAVEAHAGPVHCLGLSQEGRWLCTGGADRAIRIWDASSGVEVTRLLGHDDEVLVTAIDASGRTLVSADRHRGLKVWDVARGHDPLPIGGNEYDLQGDKVLSVHESRVVRIVDVSTGQQVREVFELLPSDFLESTKWSVALHPDGRTVALGSSSGEVQVWDTSAVEQVNRFQHHRRSVGHLVFGPDGAWLVTASWDSSLIVYSTESFEPVARVPHESQILYSEFRPDGRELASATETGTIHVWSFPQMKQSQTFSGHLRGVHALAYAPHGLFLASGGADNLIKIWDLKSGQERATLRGHDGRIESLAFSPDGTRIVSGSIDQTVKLWDVSTGKMVATYRVYSQIRIVRFSADGARITAVGRNGSLRSWNAGTPVERYVEEIIEELVIQHDVIEHLRADPELSAADRETAIAVARGRRLDPNRLNARSWIVVGQPGNDPQAYELARRQATEAARLAPHNGYLWNTLGAAQVRCGRFEEAVRSLTRSIRVNGGDLPVDYAFLLMANLGLGRPDDARTVSELLEALMRDPTWGIGDTSGPVREARQMYEKALSQL